MSDEAVRVADWDGSRPTTCGATGCLAAPAIHFEASILGCEFVAEFDVCAEHLSFASEQARAFLVAMGVVEPADTTERNIRTAAEEHVAGV
jgi:predicted deacylase